MIRIIRVVVFVIGVIAGLYGALNDYEPLTLMGAFLMVVGLMLPVFVSIGKK